MTRGTGAARTDDSRVGRPWQALPSPCSPAAACSPQMLSVFELWPEGKLFRRPCSASASFPVHFTRRPERQHAPILGVRRLTAGQEVRAEPARHSTPPAHST